MTRAVVLSGHDIAAWQERFRSGDAPARLPYEVDALEQAGYDIAIRGIVGGKATTKLRHVAEHRLGLSLQVPLRAALPAFRADVVIALLEGQGVLPGLMKRRGLPPYAGRPLVVMSVWLAEVIRTSDPDTRRGIKKRIESVDLLTHFSRLETETFVDLGIPEARLFTMASGVSHHYYTPDPDVERDIEILAIGQDRGRDYATLFKAVRGTDLTVDVVCKPENLAGLDIPDNVRIHGTVAHREYRELLRRAQIMAVPTRVLAYPTGSSVALEAASSGCCVVVTDTPAMREIFTDGVDACLIPPAEPEAWRVLLTELRWDSAVRERYGLNARHLVETRNNATAMWLELADQLTRRGSLPSSSDRRG